MKTPEEMYGILRPGLGDLQARKAVITLLDYYGGTTVYFPVPENAFKQANISEEMLGLLTDEIGDRDAWQAVSDLLHYYGGMKLYLPLARSAFREEMQEEIYTTWDGRHETRRALCRKYKISETTFNTLLQRKTEQKRKERQKSLF